jgi:hypothetical protein
MKKNYKTTTYEIRIGRQLKQHILDTEILASGLELNQVAEGKNRVLFNLTDVVYIDFSTLIWALVFFDQLKRQGYEISILLPPNPDKDINEGIGNDAYRIWSLLWRWHFFEALECIDHPSNLIPEDELQWLEDGEKKYQKGYIEQLDGNLQQAYTHNLLEITSFKIKQQALTSVEDSKEEINLFKEVWKKELIIRALMNWCRWSDIEARRFVTKIVYALLENAEEHSGGSWVLSTFNVDSKNLLLSFADNGEGIPKTLRNIINRSDSDKLKNRLRDCSDADLLIYFTKADMIVDLVELEEIKDSQLIRMSTEGILPTKGDYIGKGLYYCKQAILDYGGELRIRSGTACVVFTDGKEERPTDGLINSNGTVFRVIIPRKDYKNE